MKKIISIFIIILIIGCGIDNKSNFTDNEISKLSDSLKSYIELTRQIDEDPSFTFNRKHNYLKILDYEGNIDKIYTSTVYNKGQRLMIKKVFSLDSLGVSSCLGNGSFINFVYKRPSENMLTSAYEYRYIGILNDSIVNSNEFNSLYKLIFKKNDFYYFMENLD